MLWWYGAVVMVDEIRWLWGNGGGDMMVVWWWWN